MLGDETHGNGNITFYNYDSMHRLNVINHSYAEFYPLVEDSYTFNAGSIPTRADTAVYNGSSYDESYRQYGYDSLLRLKSEDRYTLGGSRDWGRWYTYDAGGNRIEMKVFDGSSTATTSYYYNNGDQMVERIENSALYEYTYDDNGNLYGRQDVPNDDDYWTYYTHNADNKLIEVEENADGTVALSFVYDDLGRRILRTDSNTGTKTRWWYDGLNPLLVKEKPSGGSWRTKKVYALKQEDLGAILSEREMTSWNGSLEPTAWTDRWFHYDRLGNVVMLSDSSGNVAAQYEQEAFGNVLSGGQDGFHLTTKEWDGDAGMYYFWQRWMDPASAVFIEAAPTQPTKEMRYGFTENSPTIYVDTDGRVAVIPVYLVVSRVISCGLTAYTGYLFGECMYRCQNAMQEIQNNPNIPVQIKCRLNPYDCLNECRPILDPFGRQAIGCVVSFIIRAPSGGAGQNLPPKLPPFPKPL